MPDLLVLRVNFMVYFRLMLLARFCRFATRTAPPGAAQALWPTHALQAAAEVDSFFRDCPPREGSCAAAPAWLAARFWVT